MTVDELRVMYDYGYWVNRQLFDVLSTLSDEQFTRDLVGGHASIRNTLVHAMSAEWGWMDRSGGPKRGAALVTTDYPTASSLTRKWLEVEGMMREFLAGLRDEDLERVVEFSLPGMPNSAMRVGEMMQHGAVHGVHHRGQVALLLRTLGFAPGKFDMLHYHLGRTQ